METKLLEIRHNGKLVAEAPLIVHDHDAAIEAILANAMQLPLQTGWLAGALYESRENGHRTKYTALELIYKDADSS